MAATLDIIKLMGLPVAALEGMKTVFDGDNLKLIEAALAVHTAKPGKAKKASKLPPDEDDEQVVDDGPKAKVKAAPAKPVAPPAAKVYVQRVEVYRGRARIKGGICREQIDNVIAQLQALKGHPSILTYAECQVTYPWDKEANRPA